LHRTRVRYLSGEHGSVGLAAHDVVLVELPVVRDGLCEALHGVGDALLEASAPQLDLLLLLALRGRHRGGGCSDGREGSAAAPEGDAAGGRGEASAGEGREASARKIRDWEVAAMEVVAPPVWVGGGFR
jgi:hypothetical protein